MPNFRPPMLMPWWIAKAVRTACAPVLFGLHVQAAYWETWHAVWRAPR